MRYATTTSYLRSAMERELASIQRRPSLVAVDELARLGALAFEGPDGDLRQAAIDALASRAALDASRDPEVARSAENIAAQLDLDLKLDRAVVDAGFSIELLRPLSEYAAAHAELIVQRETRVTETRAGSVELPEVRDVIKNEVAAHFRTMHRGVWRADEQYEQGQMVTSGGSMWSCQRGCIGEKNKPGNSDSWLLCVKRGNDGRDR